MRRSGCAGQRLSQLDLLSNPDPATPWVHDLVAVVSHQRSTIDSSTVDATSDTVLAHIAPGLSELGYVVRQARGPRRRFDVQSSLEIKVDRASPTKLTRLTTISGSCSKLKRDVALAETPSTVT